MDLSVFENQDGKPGVVNIVPSNTNFGIIKNETYKKNLNKKEDELTKEEENKKAKKERIARNMKSKRKAVESYMQYYETLIHNTIKKNNTQIYSELFSFLKPD